MFGIFISEVGSDGLLWHYTLFVCEDVWNLNKSRGLQTVNNCVYNIFEFSRFQQSVHKSQASLAECNYTGVQVVYRHLRIFQQRV